METLQMLQNLHSYTSEILLKESKTAMANSVEQTHVYSLPKIKISLRYPLIIDSWRMFRLHLEQQEHMTRFLKVRMTRRNSLKMDQKGTRREL